MPEFSPQPVPDPIISPSMPPFSPSGGQPGGGGRFQSVVNFYRNNKWYVWAIVLGVVIIGLLAFFAFRPHKAEPTKEANVQVTIDAPDTAPSGGEVIYKVKVENQDSAKLVNMDLELVYPEGSSYVSSTPKSENLSGSTFSVPDLANGQNAVIIVKTVANGNVNDEKQLTARLHYRFSNFNSEFVKEASHTVRLVAADVVLDVTGPQNTTNGQPVSYDVFYRNASDKDIENARIQVTYPDGFTYAESNPQPTLGQNVWNLGTLKPEGNGKITYKGTFKTARPGESQMFKIDFLVLDDNGSFFTQASTTFTTSFSTQPLAVEQHVSGPGSDGTVDPGGVLNFEIKFQNNTPVVATGVSVVAQLDPKVVDPSSIRTESGQVQDTTITWNGSSLSSLERLNPSESGTLRFTVQVKNPAAKDGSKNLAVVSKVKIKSNENQTFLPGNDLTIKVSSPSDLQGSAGYITGSLPPQVGKSSTFQVILQLRNASNDYKDAVLIGYVPVGVTFDKSSVTAKEAAAVKFDSSTGKLTWTLGQLAAGTGSFIPARKLTFNGSFTPAANQVNQPVTLFKNITFTAKDSYTSQSISLDTQPVTSSDLPDNTSQGLVQP